MKNENCKFCGKLLAGRQSVFCSISCKNKTHQSYLSQKARGLKRKISIVTQAGGKCIFCGYNKNLSALVFHHIDSNSKDFKLDMRSLSNRTKQKIEKELNKCILLCSNCHAEIHNPELDLANSL